MSDLVTVLHGHALDVLRTLPANTVQTCITSPETLAYLAGVIDSDGCISIKRSTYAMRVRKDAGQPVYSERIHVRQVEPQAIELLHETFCGSRYVTKTQTINGRSLFTWNVSDLRATLALEALLPFLRIKRAQADNGLALRALKVLSKKARWAASRGHQGSAPRSVELSQQMEACYMRAKELNRVGRRS